MSRQAQNIVDCPEISYDMIENYLAKRYEQQILNSSSIPEVEIHLILARNCNLNCTNCQAGCRIDDKDDFNMYKKVGKFWNITLNDKYSKKINEYVKEWSEKDYNSQPEKNRYSADEIILQYLKENIKLVCILKK